MTIEKLNLNIPLTFMDVVITINELVDAVNNLTIGDENIWPISDSIRGKIDKLENPKVAEPEILPCPFCQSLPVFESDLNGMCRLFCKSCRTLVVRTDWFYSENYCIESWNTRK